MQAYTEKQKQVLKAGKQEFLSRGFDLSSMEKIAEKAGIADAELTALYPDKEALFDALVKDAAEGLTDQLRSVQDAHFDLIPTNRTSESRELSARCVAEFIDFIYDHFDAFKLIICCAGQSRYADFIKHLVDLDVNRTEEYYAELRRTGRSDVHVSFRLHSMISRAYFTAVFETVACDMTKAQAEHYISQLSRFFGAGWEGISHAKD